MLVEKSNQTVRPVAKRVCMDSCCQHPVRAAEIRSNAVPHLAGMKIFPGAIAQNRQRLIGNFIVIAVSVPIPGWKITINTAPDSRALSPDRYCLRDFNPAVLPHVNVTMKNQYPFVSFGNKWQEQQQQQIDFFHSILPRLTSGTFATSSDVF